MIPRANVPKLVLRIIALNLIALPLAFLCTTALSLLMVSLPHERQEFYGVGVGVFMLTVVGPGIASALLIVLNQLVSEKKLGAKTSMRAGLWGGGMVLAVALASRVVPTLAGNLGFWVAASSLVAFSAELIQRP